MDQNYNPKNVKLSGKEWLLLGGLGALSGSIVGQAIDNAYSMNDALHYHNPYFSIPSIGFELVWWIPFLYAAAGALIVILITLFNKLLNREDPTEAVLGLPQEPRGGFNPKWGFTSVSIIVFVVHWLLGCYLTHFISNAWLLVILVLWGLLIWWIFDRTAAGLILCVMTACLGMVIEITFINVFGLYHYTHPDFLGIPFWVAGHYIAGTPANMNLGRKYLAFLHDKQIRND